MLCILIMVFRTAHSGGKVDITYNTDRLNGLLNEQHTGNNTSDKRSFSEVDFNVSDDVGVHSHGDVGLTQAPQHINEIRFVA